MRVLGGAKENFQKLFSIASKKGALRTVFVKKKDEKRRGNKKKENKRKGERIRSSRHGGGAKELVVPAGRRRHREQKTGEGDTF